jgi:hypothetical protein
MTADIETSWSQPRFGNCERCTFHTKLNKATGEIGKFLGNPAYDDLWLCDLCLETQELKGDQLLLYIANLLFSRVYYRSGRANEGYRREDG